MDFTAATGVTVMRASTELFKNTGKWNHNAGNDMNQEDLIRGSALFVLQLEKYFSESGQYMALVKTGNLRLEVQFKAVLTGKLLLTFVYFFISIVCHIFFIYIYERRCY